MLNLKNIPSRTVLVFSKNQTFSSLILDNLEGSNVNYKIIYTEEDLISLFEKGEFSLLILNFIKWFDFEVLFGERIKIKPNFNSIFLVLEEFNENLPDVTSVDLVTKFPSSKIEFKKLLKSALEIAYYRELEAKLHINQGNSSFFSNRDDNQIKNGKFLIQKKSIYNLATSLSQGSGLGTSVSLIDMIQSMSEKEGDYYKVDSELMQLLYTNNQFSRGIIEGLHKMVNLLDETIKLEEIEITKYLEEISVLFRGLKDLLDDKKIKLVLPNFTSENKIYINQEKFNLVLEELVINAFKYSLEGTLIHLEASISNNRFILIVKNQVNPTFYGGVPPDMEKLVIEPFIRIYPPGDENLNLLRFGLGLGLTAIDYIINQHNGIFVIKDEIHENDSNILNYVNAEISLPIIKREER